MSVPPGAHDAATVSGFPLHLTGWNTAWDRGSFSGLFTRPDQNWNYRKIRVDVYRMNSYTLFKFIDIIGVEIRKDSEGIFRIWRDGDTDFFPGYRLETDNEIYETTGGEVRHFTVVCK